MGAQLVRVHRSTGQAIDDMGTAGSGLGRAGYGAIEMKKTFTVFGACVLSAVVLVVLAFVIVRAASLELVNPGFETGDLSGWTFNCGSSSVVAGHSGSYGGRCGDGPGDVYSSPFSVSVGLVTGTIWYSGNGISFRLYDGSTYYTLRTPAQCPITGGGWSECTGSVSVPAGEYQLAVTIGFGHTVDLDDASASFSTTPIGTGITYQGRLLDAASNPINGTCAMTFTLWTASAGGSQIGSAVVVTSVSMSNGYFATTLDFGSAAWNGDARWLEPVAACNGGAAETFDRQAVTVVPYAVHSLDPTSTPQPTPTIIPNIAYTNTANVFTTTQTIRMGASDFLQFRNASNNLLSYVASDGSLNVSSIGKVSNAKVEVYRLQSSDVGTNASDAIYANSWTNAVQTYGVNGYRALASTSHTSGIQPSVQGMYFQALSGSKGSTTYVVGINGWAGSSDTGNVLYLIGSSNSLQLYGQAQSVTNGYGMQIGLSVLTGTLSNYYGVYVSSPVTNGTGVIGSATGLKIDPMNKAAANFSIYGSSGQYHLGDSVEVSGTIQPVLTGTSDLGTSALAWNQVHAKQYVTHSWGDWSAGVTLRNMTVVSCSVAIEKLKKHSTKLTPSGKPHLDYEDPEFPIDAYIPAVDEWVTRILTGTITPTLSLSSTVVAVTPVHNEQGAWLWNEYVIRVLLPGESGADMDVLNSIMLCASKEFSRDIRDLKARIIKP